MKVSVCMATYNGGKYIREQMDSILGQEFKENLDVEMEIIVSDDGSTDDTITIIESYHDERIKIFHHTQHKKHKYYKAMFACTANFGYAMEKATGDYVFLCDQDDVWFLEKIDKTLTQLIKHGGMVATSFYVTDMNLKPYGVPVKYDKEPRFRLRRRNMLYGFSCGMTRQFANAILPIPIIPHHDNYMALVASFSENLTFINEPLAYHRWSGVHNVSSYVDKSPFYIKNYYRAKMVVLAFLSFLIYKKHNG